MSWTSGIQALVHEVFTFQLEEVGWTGFSIIAILLVFIYSPSAAGICHPQASSLILAEKKLEQCRKDIRENRSKQRFRLKCLPPELLFLVLSYSADWPETYRALALVSRYIYHSTLRACLPVMPITLSSTKQLISFASLVHGDKSSRHRLDKGNLVHHLWISPLRNEDFAHTYHILRACANIRVLACDARVLALITHSRNLKHTFCRDLTLLLSHLRWVHAFNTPSGYQFLQQLTHLRVMGEQSVPKTLSFDRLLYLSYPERSCSDTDMGDSVAERPSALSNKSTYPSLRQVVLTRRSSISKGAPLLCDPMLVLLHTRRDITEMEIWRNGCKGQSLWQQAEKTLPEKTCCCE